VQYEILRIVRKHYSILLPPTKDNSGRSTKQRFEIHSETKIRENLKMNHLQSRNHNNYYYTFLLALLLVGMMIPFTDLQAIDVAVESRATTGMMYYQFKENYPGSDDLIWQDTFPVFGVGSTISIPLNFCERLFFDVYGQQSDVGSDHEFYSVFSERTKIYDRDGNVDFSRRDWAGTLGCTVPKKIFFDGSVTLTFGYKGSQTEINGTHRLYFSGGGGRIFPEDSTILKIDGVFGGVSMAWPLGQTWQFQINLAYGRFQSEYGSDYRGNVEGTITGITSGIKLQNTLTRHLTWGISVDYLNYDMAVDSKTEGDPIEGIGERIIPIRASLIWRF